MAKERLFNLPETKGGFQLKGIVGGTRSNNFFNESKTKTGKDMHIANFSVDYKKDEKLYVKVMGTEQDSVYFYKAAKEKGQKGDTQTVPWANRFNYNCEGYKMIGTNVGVRKIINEKGEEVNDKKTLTPFDAANEIYANLRDNVSVFVRGNLRFSSYEKNGNKICSINLDPNQISLCRDVDFDEEDYEQVNDFNQVIVYTGIEQEKDDDGKPTGRFVVSAKIITHSTVEDAEFVIVDKSLASVFRKNLKPYYAIKVSGHIVSETQTEEVSEEDSWGESDAMEKVKSSSKVVYIITGAKPSTIDKETYTEENVSEAIAAVNRSKNADRQFGSDTSDNWGESGSNFEEEEEAW